MLTGFDCSCEYASPGSTVSATAFMVFIWRAHRELHCSPSRLEQKLAALQKAEDDKLKQEKRRHEEDDAKKQRERTRKEDEEKVKGEAAGRELLTK